MNILKLRNYFENFELEEEDNIFLFEKFETGVPEVGDWVEVVEKDQKKLDQEVFDYLFSQPMFKILKIKKNEKGNIVIDIGCKHNGKTFNYPLRRFRLIEPPIQEREGYVNIIYSPAMINILKDIKNDPISKFLLELRYGIETEKVRPDFVNYFDLDKQTKGNVTYIRNDEVGNRVTMEEVWTTKRRQSSTILRALRRVFNDAYLKILDNEWNKVEKKEGVREMFKISKSEKFVNEWKLQFDNELTVKVLRGEESLRAYNYTGEIQLNTFDSSCANFQNKKAGHALKDYDFYVKNPEHCGIATLFRKGKILGRAPMFEGIAQFDSGDFKKGEYYKIFNNYYTDRDPKCKPALDRWGAENGVIKTAGGVTDLKSGKRLTGYCILPFKTRVCEIYPPVDYFAVNIKDDLICHQIPHNVKGCDAQYWTGAYGCNAKAIANKYKLKCPDNYE